MNKVTDSTILTLSLQFEKRPKRSFGGGFCMEWLSFLDENGSGYRIESGAGLGNDFLTICIVEKNDIKEYYDFKMRDILEKIIKALGRENQEELA